MARTLEESFSNLETAKGRIGELFQEIEQEKLIQADLSSLNSPSKTASWRLWAWITALCQYVMESFFDDHKQEMTELAAAIAGGSASWYVKKAKEFQFGDVLQLVNDVPSYAVTVSEEDPKRVVKFSALTETFFGGSVLKVAGWNGNDFIPLTPEQKTAFDGYIEALHFVGSKPAIVSEAADQLRVYATVYYNPQYDLANLKMLVGAAIDVCRRSVSEKGELFAEAIQDAIQTVPGVRPGVVLTNVQARKAGDIWTNVQRKYTAYAGYMILDPGTSLETSITYVPE